MSFKLLKKHLSNIGSVDKENENKKTEISKEKLFYAKCMKKYLRVVNYLCVSQIYLKDNVLLEKKLSFSDIKNRLLGHFGTTPGINFVYASTNYLINKYDKDNYNFTFVLGPGHGFPAIQANLFLEKSLEKYYPKNLGFNRIGITNLCSKFSQPYGFPSHSNPSAPGTILEGGELGYCLSVSFGAVLDNKKTICICLIGDGESETGPLLSSLNINKIFSIKDNGAVLPILHLNEYKISGPTTFGRMKNEDIQKYFSGLLYEPVFVDYNFEKDIHLQMLEKIEYCYKKIKKIQNDKKGKWPLIILRTKKGWYAPKFFEGKKIEGNHLTHQVVFENVKNNKKEFEIFEKWIKSYKINELLKIDEKDNLILDKDVEKFIPKKPMGKNEITNDKKIKKLKLPKLDKLVFNKNQKNKFEKLSSMGIVGKYYNKILELNKKENNFRIFSPDETYSNKLDCVFNSTKRVFMLEKKNWDTDLAEEGKVMEQLSEHNMFGLMQGYVSTKRYGVFATYESFAQITSSMLDQYAKFLKAKQNVRFRKKLPPANIILTSLLERQDHNGFSHQNPGFIASAIEKDENIIECIFPIDSNSTLKLLEYSFSQMDKINILVISKKENYQYIDIKKAEKLIKNGYLEIEEFCDKNPDLVFASCGDYIFNETYAGLILLKKYLPKLKTKFVAISRIKKDFIGDIKTDNEKEMDKIFTKDKNVIFNFHGYPSTIKKILFDYKTNFRFKVFGYEECGSTTSPEDMMIRNNISRFQLVINSIEILLKNKKIDKKKYEEIKKSVLKKLETHRKYILENGDDPKEIYNFLEN